MRNTTNSPADCHRLTAPPTGANTPAKEGKPQVRQGQRVAHGQVRGPDQKAVQGRAQVAHLSHLAQYALPFPIRDILSVLGGPPPANTEKMQSSSPSSSSAVSSSRSSRAFSCDDQRTTRTGGSKNGRIYTKVSSADWPCVPARGMLAMHAPAGARPTVCEGWARGGELAKVRTAMYYILLLGLVLERIRVCFLPAYTNFAERLQMAAAVGGFNNYFAIVTCAVSFRPSPTTI